VTGKYEVLLEELHVADAVCQTLSRGTHGTHLPGLYRSFNVTAVFPHGGVDMRSFLCNLQRESVPMYPHVGTSHHKSIPERWKPRIRPATATLLVPSWRWLLPFPAHNATAPPHFPGGGKKINGNVNFAPDTGAPVLAYILVCDDAARDAELRQAMQRNVTSAAVLRQLRAAANANKVSAPPHGAAAESLPQPRYYAPFVADGGSPITVNGCLSDIFVLEFVSECA
jgi:hypothetical protein